MVAVGRRIFTPTPPPMKTTIDFVLTNHFSLSNDSPERRGDSLSLRGRSGKIPRKVPTSQYLKFFDCLPHFH